MEALEGRTLLSTSAQFNSPTTALGPQTLTLNFDVDVSSLLTASEVQLKNLTNGDTINVSSPKFSNGGMTAQFTFISYVDFEGSSHPAVSDNAVAGWLRNGFYRVKLSASDLPALGQDFSSDFYFIAADANNDGQVNGDDYFAIDQGFAGHLNGSANGDFNLDGRIDADDYFAIDSVYGRNYQAPGSIAFFSPTTAEIDLDWVPSSASDVHQYFIYRSTDPNFTPSDSTFLDFSDTSSYEDTDLTPATTYYYIVNQLHDDGSETPVGTDPAATTRVTDPNLPGTPTNFSALAINDLEIQLTWTPAGKNQNAFIIQRSDDGVNFSDFTTVNAKANAWTDRNLAVEHNYYYRIAASNAKGRSAYSSIDHDLVGDVGYQTMVVIVGGHEQTMWKLDHNAGDPNATNGRGAGLGDLAKKLRDQDYNVFMFSEFGNEDVDLNGLGKALDEIEREIEERNIQYIAFVGYSHGASACYHISQRLADDIPFEYPFEIPYVGYIDAVQRTTTGDTPADWLHANPETNTPIGMETGENIWEPNGTKLVKGAPISGMVNTEKPNTDNGGHIDHTKIDDQQSVINQIDVDLQFAMPPS